MTLPPPPLSLRIEGVTAVEKLIAGLKFQTQNPIRTPPSLPKRGVGGELKQITLPPSLALSR